MKIDIVIPFYNEEGCAAAFVDALKSSLDPLCDINCSYYLVDDGSTDNTLEILTLLSKEDRRISVVSLWGNHGHQRALVAGLDQCHGDAVLMMDGDGQHPTETAVKLVQTFLRRPESAIVQGVRKGHQENILKDWTSRFFYWTINRMVPEIKIVPGSSDFRVIGADALNLVRSYSDRHRNLRVLLASLKLPTIFIDYVPDQRWGGRSKYGWRKMLRLGIDGLFAFSSFPLRINLFLMMISGMLGVGYTVYSLFVFVKGQVVPGWTSIIALISLLFCAMFGALAVISEYVLRIYQDVRRYPLYRIHAHQREATPNQNELMDPAPNDVSDME